MASAALSIPHGVEGGWFARSRHSITLCALLEPAQSAVLQFVEAACTTKPGYSAFKRILHREIATVIRYSVESTARAVHQLLEVGAITRLAGSRSDYRCCPENYQKIIDRFDPQPRRKPIQRSESSSPPLPSAERRTGESEQKGKIEHLQSVSKDEPVVHAEFLGVGPEETQAPRNGDQPERPSKSEQLETFCLATITPRLGTIPEKSAIDRAVRFLVNAPVEMLMAHISRRIELFESKKGSWGALPMLAQDVGQAFHKLTKLRGKAMPIDLSVHWKSAAEVRRMHKAPETPEHVRCEILQMWPELNTTPEVKKPRLMQAEIEWMEQQKAKREKAKQ